MRYSPRLEQSEIDQALRHNHALWGSGRTLDEHLAYNAEQMERAGPELLRYVGLVDRGEVVASIKRYSLMLARGERRFRAVGIGAVFTRPDRRGEGLGSRLLSEVKQEAADLGYEAALLYSDIDPSYYARLGFVALDAVEHEAPSHELPEQDPLELRPAHADETKRLIALHDASFGARPDLLRLMRTPAIFRYFAWRNRVHGAYLLTDAGHTVGYLLATRDDPLRDLPNLAGDALWVDDAFAEHVPRARVLATIRMLALHTGVTRVRAWLRPDDAAAPFTARVRSEAIPMIAPLGGSELDPDPARAFLDAFGHF